MPGSAENSPAPHSPPHEILLSTHSLKLPPLLVWGSWLLMIAVGILNTALHYRRQSFAPLINIALLAAAAFAFTLAVRRVRHHTRTADAFFSLVLLNPLLYLPHPQLLNPTLLGTALLGLMAGAIIAMKRDNFLRYLAVALLALALARVSETFIMLLPALVAWFLIAGYLLARSPVPSARRRGILIMTLAEIMGFFFGLACILIPPTTTPAPATLFSSIVSFADFPLLVLAIILLALGWRKGPNHTTPPHFAGTLALLVGLLTMLLNNFQSGSLPPPGADQSTLVLCLVYTVSALHGPRRLQQIAPPILLILSILYTLFG